MRRGAGGGGGGKGEQRGQYRGHEISESLLGPGSDGPRGISAVSCVLSDCFACFAVLRKFLKTPRTSSWQPGTQIGLADLPAACCLCVTTAWTRSTGSIVV